MPGTIFVVGPTSVGKSSVALALAEQRGGEILNADAFQIYEGIETLTSCPSADECQRVPHHLFGFVPLGTAYNVAEYALRARRCLGEIHGRGRLAVVVGGTGLYVKALTHGLSPLPPSDPVLRGRLEALSLEELTATLAVADPLGSTQIDLKNKRRVIRALEISVSTGQPFSSYRDAWNQSVYGVGEAGVFLDRERDDLCARIDARVEKMFREGAVEEVRGLPIESIGDTAAGAIGLSEIRSLLDGRLSLPECMNRTKVRTRQYAKRQVTWFKREQVFRRVGLRSESSSAAPFFLPDLGFPTEEPRIRPE